MGFAFGIIFGIILLTGVEFGVVYMWNTFINGLHKPTSCKHVFNTPYDQIEYTDWRKKKVQHAKDDSGDAGMAEKA